MTSLDEQLAASSPDVPVGSPELDAEFVRIIAQAEAAAGHRQRRPSRGIVVGGVVVGVLGVGAAAAAAGIVPWFDSAPSRGVVTTSSGERCTLTFDVKKLDDPAAPVGDAVRAKVTDAAERFLENLDLSTLSVARATRAAPPRPTVDSEAGPAMSVDEYEVEAIYKEVGRRLDAHLARQQLPVSAVSLAMASSCDRGDQ